MLFTLTSSHKFLSSQQILHSEKLAIPLCWSVQEDIWNVSNTVKNLCAFTQTNKSLLKKEYENNINIHLPFHSVWMLLDATVWQEMHFQYS